MLSKKDYSRQQLINIYKTDRLDAIKKRITREGYTYKDSGRGKNYVLSILSIPEDREFEIYCIEKLQFKPQTDFNKLKYFLYNILADEEFKQLQLNEMQEKLEKQGIHISNQTISNYFKHLFNINWLSNDLNDYIYYMFDTKSNHNKYISKEEYYGIYTECKTIKKVLSKYGAIPKKKMKIVDNGFYINEYNTLLEIIKRSLI